MFYDLLLIDLLFFQGSEILPKDKKTAPNPAPYYFKSGTGRNIVGFKSYIV
jgi:hypothetical protein